MKRRLRLPSPAMLVALAALFVALGGTGMAGANKNVTLWPWDSARWANMDWECFFHKEIRPAPQAIVCGRESTERGVEVYISGETVELRRCPKRTRIFKPCSLIARVDRAP